MHQRTGRTRQRLVDADCARGAGLPRRREALAEAARAISELTHYDPDAADACVLCSFAIRHAVLTGELDARIGLHHIDADRRETVGIAAGCRRVITARPTSPTTAGWSRRCRRHGPRSRPRRSRTDDPPAGVFRVDHLRLALDAAVRGGYDTDTVAAIAGGLLGAAYGASAVPLNGVACCTAGPEWRPATSWQLATRIVQADKPFSYDVDPMNPVRHPHDDGVWLGDVATLQALPSGVDSRGVAVSGARQ